MSKVCIKCKELKPLDNYARDKSKKTNRRSYCKQCHNLGNRMRRNGTLEYKRPVFLSNGVTKKCSKCLEEKNISDFGFHKHLKEGLDYWCKKCSAESKKGCRLKKIEEYKLTNRRATLKRKFNLTLEQYDRLLETQRGECAICGTDKGDGKGSRFMVDHDHKTGLVRGLLCRKCNSALGLFKENSYFLRKAMDYLDNHHRLFNVVLMRG